MCLLLFFSHQLLRSPSLTLRNVFFLTFSKQTCPLNILTLYFIHYFRAVKNSFMKPDLSLTLLPFIINRSTFSTIHSLAFCFVFALVYFWKASEKCRACSITQIAFDSSVGRAVDCRVRKIVLNLSLSSGALAIIDIHRSLVQIRFEGNIFFVEKSFNFFNVEKNLSRITCMLCMLKKLTLINILPNVQLFVFNNLMDISCLFPYINFLT
jgi:uncharacterized membrane protein (DUF485 family)